VANKTEENIRATFEYSATGKQIQYSNTVYLPFLLGLLASPVILVVRTYQKVLDQIHHIA